MGVMLSMELYGQLIFIVSNPCRQWVGCVAKYIWCTWTLFIPEKDIYCYVGKLIKRIQLHKAKKYTLAIGKVHTIKSLHLTSSTVHRVVSILYFGCRVFSVGCCNCWYISLHVQEVTSRRRPCSNPAWFKTSISVRIWMQFLLQFIMCCFMYISSNAPHDSFSYPLQNKEFYLIIKLLVQKQLHSVGQCIDTHGSLAIFG